ncbi:hypothetical protein ACM26V_10575 [Salipaludibacillus sp. HK11]|uniref:hypothetical protein n=1 Tax=Salipaludibacillus sp. HK11 TaxID=3394320 RepID=UPI0039FBDC64
MIQLDHIERSYPFRNVSWIQKNKIINTEKGKKAIEVWTDEDLLNWHIQWRERLAEETGVLTNRVIQTKTGAKALSTDIGWITIHDVVDSLFPISENPYELGRFLGKYASIETEQLPPPIIDQAIQRKIEFEDVHMAPTPSSSLLEKTRREAVRRVKKAEELMEGCDKRVSKTKVTKVESLDQAKSVQGQLFWENKEKEVEHCIDMLCSCFREWVTSYGIDDIGRLLDGVNETFQLEEDAGQMLLARFVYPNEYESFVEWFHDKRNENEINTQLNHLTQQWDVTKTIVEQLVHWLEQKKEKVSV